MVRVMVIRSYLANLVKERDDALKMRDLVTEQRDELARQLGIEPEWTSDDA